MSCSKYEVTLLVYRGRLNNLTFYITAISYEIIFLKMRCGITVSLF